MEKKIEKIPYLTEVNPDRLEKDIKKVSTFFEKIKPAYVDIFKEVQKMTPQQRCFITETLLMSVISDANIPNYLATGIIEKIKFNIQNGMPTSVSITKSNPPTYTG